MPLKRLKRLGRVLGRAALIGTAGAALAVAVFLITASGRQADFQPIAEPLGPELTARIQRTPHYKRAEDATYLTFVEWYLVFNPQEYAAFIERQRPSEFPYFRGVRQIWSGY